MNSLIKKLRLHGQHSGHMSDTAVEGAIACQHAADHIEELTALLVEAADDLEASAANDYPNRDKHPDEMRRWKRDMDLVNRIMAALQLQESKND